MIKRFLTEEDGATAIEYGLIVALVGGALITALGEMGNSLVAIYDLVAGDVEEAARCVEVGSNCKK
jgi:pilus assembly protein Flp/PilA